MGYQERRQLLAEMGRALSCQVIAYVCGDRPIVGTRLSDDAIRPMYDHLRAVSFRRGAERRIGLYLYSIGGVMETPWKLVTMLREHCDEFVVVLPYKAYSAATMICMGADRILMTDKAELGPIDPALQPASGPEAPQQFLLRELGVEDVASYVKFLRERAGLTDQAALSSAIGTLAEHLTPTLLGRMERIHGHIRLVARKLLALCRPPLDDRRISTIVEALTERTYVHGHGIGRREASEMGLQVEPFDGKAARLAWDLFEDYEQQLRLDASPEPLGYFEGVQGDEYAEDGYTGACIESSALAHAFLGTWLLQRRRKIPPNPTINVNVSLNLPPSVQPGQLPPDLQKALQQAVQQAVQQVPRQVTQELTRQSPVESVQGFFRGAAWRRVT